MSLRMVFFFRCDNAKCLYYNKIRTINVLAITEGLFDKPNPICSCSWYARPLTEKEIKESEL
jgi:hypothetical protein